MIDNQDKNASKKRTGEEGHPNNIGRNCRQGLRVDKLTPVSQRHKRHKGLQGEALDTQIRQL